MAFPDYIQTSMICSLEHITFLVKFINEGDQQTPNYRIYSYKVPNSRYIAEQGAPAQNDMKFDTKYFDCSDFECPICETGVKNKIRVVECGDCNELVCMGASTNTDFICYKACGSTSSWEYSKRLASLDAGKTSTNRALLGNSSKDTKRLGHTLPLSTSKK